MMEDQLYAMMEAIVNNRNLILDKKIFRVNEDAPKINIYIGSDFGFCSNYNSQVNDQLHKDPAGDVKILIGKKLRSAGLENVWDQIPYSRLEEESGRIQKFLEKQIRTKKCSGINLIYNHYENTTNIDVYKRQTDLRNPVAGVPYVYAADGTFRYKEQPCYPCVICKQFQYGAL